MSSLARSIFRSYMCFEVIYQSPIGQNDYYSLGSHAFPMYGSIVQQGLWRHETAPDLATPPPCFGLCYSAMVWAFEASDNRIWSVSNNYSLFSFFFFSFLKEHLDTLDELLDNSTFRSLCASLLDHWFLASVNQVPMHGCRSETSQAGLMAWVWECVELIIWEQELNLRIDECHQCAGNLSSTVKPISSDHPLVQPKSSLVMRVVSHRLYSVRYEVLCPYSTGL